MRNIRKSVVILLFIGVALAWTQHVLSKEPIELVPWEKLADFIIEIPGWDKKGELEGVEVDVPSKSEVWQTYVSETGSKSLEINIFDSDKEMITLMPIKMMMNNSKTSDGYTEKITIAGFPGAKIYDVAQKKAGLIVLILDRFVLQMFGSNFAESEVEDLVEAAKQHDLEGIGNLGK